MKRRILLLICLCFAIYTTACENNITANSVADESSVTESGETNNAPDISDDGIPKEQPPVEEYLPVEITARISDDKPEYRFVKRIDTAEEIGSKAREDYTKAVIDVYETGTTDKLIDSIEILVDLGGGFPLPSKAIWESFYLIDVNFDGYNDIVVLQAAGGMQGMHTYDCFTWNEGASWFEAAPFPDWGFVSVDSERKMLLTAWRNWAASHGWAIYEYIDGVLTKTNECSREYLDNAEDGTAIIHLKATQLIDGEMQTVFDGNVNEEELDAYLLYDNLWQLGSDSWVGVWTVNEI